NSNAAPVLIASPTQTGYADSGLTNGTSYTYALAGFAGAEGPWSINASNRPTTAHALPPVNLSAKAGNGMVTLLWDPTPGATYYYLYRWVYGANASPVQIANTSQTTYVDASAANGLSYNYAVAGVASGVEGPWLVNPSNSPSAGLPLPPTNVVVRPGNASV